MLKASFAQKKPPIHFTSSFAWHTQVARAGGVRSDEEVRALNARIAKLTSVLEEVNSEHSMLLEQVRVKPEIFYCHWLMMMNSEHSMLLEQVCVPV